MRPDCPDCPTAYQEGLRRGLLLGMVEAYSDIVLYATGLQRLHERELITDDELRGLLRATP